MKTLPSKDEFKTYTLKMQSMEKEEDWFSITFRCKEIENYDVMKFAKATGKFEGAYTVQLELGEVATPFKHQESEETKAKCKRYYEKAYKPKGDKQMKTLPSKELLSSVLGIEIDTVFGLFDDKVFRFNTPIDEYTVSINIHELSYMVKEWIINHRLVHSFDVETYEKGVYVSIVIYRESIENQLIEFRPEDRENTAIFKFGEWVLKEISK